MTREQVAGWVAAYERAWRAPGTGALAGIFTPDATYRQGPYDEPVTGLPAIGGMWEAERDGPGKKTGRARTRLVGEGCAMTYRDNHVYTVYRLAGRSGG